LTKKGIVTKIEDKSVLLEDRGQISKIEQRPLKNQADGHSSLRREGFDGYAPVTKNLILNSEQTEKFKIPEF
jgi:hypothetical protein